jgi:hypothetical protein
MTPTEFRRIALGLPDVTESSHMNHPDFRVGGKIFASLGWPDDAWGMVKLTPAEQAMFVQAKPEAFEPVPGGWGRRGSTKVRLQSVDEATLRSAIGAAWCWVAPKGAAAKRAGPRKLRNRPAKRQTT